MECIRCKAGHKISPEMYNQMDGSTESLESNASNSSFLCTIRRSNVLLSFYIPFYILFLVSGAMVFSVLEQETEGELRQEIRDGLAAFKDNHNCVSEGELEYFIEKVLEARGNGITALQNATGESIWSFGQSLFFASTIVTTIGYGSTHPLTQGGKVFCIFYAIVGIPLTFILISALVERLLTPTYWLLNRLVPCLNGSIEIMNIKVVNLLIMGSISICLYFVIPAFIFSYIEHDWNFLDAFYYCFISLTTIGLGDYTPGDNIDQPYRALYKICTTGYLLVGVTFVMYMLRLFNDIPHLNLGQFLMHTSDQTRNEERVRLKESMKASSRKYSGSCMQENEINPYSSNSAMSNS